MTTQTLTDRYVYAVQRSLPERQREDIDRELRATIADTIDAKVEAGDRPDAAERAVLTELGDPYRLALGYADRPVHLIGPKVFPDYIRLLKVLYAIVLPIVFAAVILAQLLAGAPNGFWGAFGSAIGIIVSVAAHFGFWTTLVFALIERSPDYKATTWSLDSLPQVPAKGAIKLSDTVASAVWFVIWVGALIWAQFFSLFRDAEGAVIPVLDPALWSFWLPYLLVLVALEMVFRVVLYRMRRWTVAAAVIYIVGVLAFTVPAVWLVLTQHLMNPAFLQRADIASSLFAPDGVVTIIVLIVLVAGSAGAIADAVVRTVRARRAV
jgi:hypothetical protein